MFRLLLQDPVIMDTDHLFNELWWFMHPSLSCLQVIKDLLRPRIQELTWEERVEMAFLAVSHSGNELPRRFLEILDVTAVDARIAQACNGEGSTILHMMVTHRLLNREQEVLSSWPIFIQQLLKNGAEIHATDINGRTPFDRLLRDVLRPGCAVRCWVSLLQSAGVDLDNYGRIEMAAWNTMYPKGLQVGGWRTIRSWTYGPLPADWTVMQSQTEAIWTAERTTQIPGAWVAAVTPPITLQICWSPDEEDELEGWRWCWDRDFEIHSCSSQRLQNDEDGQDDDLFATQDDCGRKFRAVEQLSKGRVRARSYSQPQRRHETSSHRRRNISGHWHRCCFDGKTRFAEHYRCDRRCARELHDLSLYEIYLDRIDYQMRRFRDLFEDKSDLLSLPYSAYRNYWW